MDVAIQGDDGDLLGSMVVAQGSNSIGLFTGLRSDGSNEFVRRDGGRSDLFNEIIGDTPERDRPITGARHHKLIVDPRHVKDPILVSTLGTSKAGINQSWVDQQPW